MSRGDSIIGLLVGVLILFTAAVLLSQILKPDTWTAFYDQPDLPYSQTLAFDSRDSCLNWIHNPLNHIEGRYDFECGSNCRLDDLVNDIYRCKETAD